MAHGCIKHNTKNHIGVHSNSNSSGGSDEFSYDPTIHIYASSYLAPARDDSNITMFTWNANLVGSGFRMYRVWRILTTTRPSNFSWYDDWDVTDNPTSILSNLNNAVTKNITSSADEGDLYRDWINTDDYSGYYVAYLVTYESDDRYWASWSAPAYNGSNYKIQCYCTGSTPSLSFDETTGKFSIGTSMTGRRFLEFHRSDKSYGYPTNISNEETLNEMLLTSIIGQEYSDPREMYYGYYSIGNRTLNRWAKGTYTVGVRFLDTQNKSIISSAINAAISEANDVLNDFGVYFVRSGTSGDMTITVDTEWNHYGIDVETADYVYGGTWDTEVDSDGYIISADVCLVSDVYDYIPFGKYDIAAFEEIIQSMGAGYDQVEYPFNTVHTEFNYFNKSTTLSTKDRNILKLVYSSYVNPNDEHYEVSRKLNIPKGVYRVSTSTTNSVRSVSCSNFLEEGIPYQVRAFIVNSSGKLSYTSSWINITTPSLGKPSNLTISNRVNTGARISWNAATIASGYEVQIISNWNNVTQYTRTTTNTYVSVTGLPTGTTHTVKVRAYSSFYGTKEYSDWVTLKFTTNPSQPVLSVSAVNKTITVSWSLADSSSDYTNIWINLYDSNDTNMLQSHTITSGSGSSGSFTYTVSSEGTYWIRAQTMVSDSYVSGTNLVCLNSSGSSYTCKVSIDVSLRPDNWSWTTSNGSATTSQTKAAYTAVMSKGLITAFSYLVWNDFVDKVKEFLSYTGDGNKSIGTSKYGYSSTTSYSTLISAAKMTSSDKTITTKRFNIVNYCINVMNSTGITDRSSGNIIYGSYFTTLATKLNQI